MKSIGREREHSILKGFFDSDRAEFLAIYGRRRIGKTYLIRESFKNNKKAVFFNAAGAKEDPLSTQINRFIEEISQTFYHSAPLAKVKTWDAAFQALTKAFEIIPKKTKIVLFFDEFPWMATKNSRLLSALDYYWNQYWSQDNRIKLIICGSSASWIVKKIINNKGGLHNRITRKIRLAYCVVSERRLRRSVNGECGKS